MKKENATNKKVIKLGGYSIVITAVVIAIVIIVNLSLNLLPSKYTKYSTSSIGLYEISDISRDIMSKVKDKITVYIVAESDYVNSLAKEYIAKYTDLNSNVSYSTVDPAVQPGFVSQYTDEALSSVETNLILVNQTNGRSRVITYDEIFPVQYSEEELYYYYYYGVTPTGTTYFNIEQSLTSAIDYLTAENLPVVYYVTGHGEVELDTTITDLIDDENIEYKELPLLAEGTVPEDASAVLINAASKDFTNDEITALQEYTANGGNVIMTSYYNTSLESRNLENLYGFAKSMGLEYNDVFVLEGSAANYYSYYGPSYILPNVVSNDFTSSLSSNTNMIMYSCHAITLSEEKPEGITLSELLTTTVKGYAKTEINENTTSSKEEGDIEGKYVIGAMSTMTNSDNGTEGKLVWFSSSAIIDSGTAGSFSNLSYFMSVLTNLCEKEASVTINAKSLQIESLTVSEASANLWGIILIGVIPIITLSIGFIIWKRRIKR